MNILTENVGLKDESSKSKEKEQVDHDSLWKDLIKRFLYSLLKRAVPELYEEADLNQEPRFLDKEFQDILNTSDPAIHQHPHFADVVSEVPLKNGDSTCVLLHVEAQRGKGERNLSERMNHYRCLIYAHHRREPVALALIVGRQPKSEMSHYEHSHYGTKVVYEYNNLCLLDLDDEELLASDNPIDMALYAAKMALKVKEEHQKYNYLYMLTGLLAERGWDTNEKRDLGLFLARIINLQDWTLQERYWEYRRELDKEGKIMYENWLKEVEERMAAKQGAEKCKEEMVKKLFANGVSPDVIAKSADMPIERVRTLLN